MRYRLVFAGMMAMPGCITVNSPLFPGPIVFDRACPRMAGATMPDTTPEAPTPEPAPVMVPRLQPPIEMEPAGGGRSRRLMARD